MQRRLRLTGDRRFNEIHQNGRSTANRYLVLRALPNGLEHNRYGILVGKRIGNAVTRNKVKRRLREVLRQTPIKTGWDAVLITRRGADQASFQELARSVNNLFRRTGLLIRSTEGDGP